MIILLTGGAGYIGTHIAVELLKNAHEVVIVDNFCNSTPEAVSRVEKITGKPVTLYEGDVCDHSVLDGIFSDHSIDGVIHLAGLKAVGESHEQPLAYYRNNIDSTLTLVEAMLQHGVNNLVFSSSATVYGTPESLPYTEESRVGLEISNPYGQTKYMIEQILRDVAVANPEFAVTLLRYFNPIGAHPSGLIGEDPSGVPNNLMPYIAQTAIGKRPEVLVFGDDYDTPDGTGVRDYIHVVDLARGHIAALEHASNGTSVYNLGSGQGTSVLELIRAFSEATGKEIPYTITERRAGDLAAYFASADNAARVLGWQTELSIADACRDTWNWQLQNPDGYKTSLK